MMEDIKLFQVYYDEETKKELDPQCTPYFNQKCNKYFENQVIVDIYDAGLMSDCRFFGILSWRAKHKIGKLPDIREIINSNSKYDYYYFALNVAHPWREINEISGDHTTFTELILEKMGWKANLTTMKMHSVFFNYQICKTELYREYVATFLKPFMQLLETSDIKELQEWLLENCRYIRPLKPLSEEKLIEICGVPYYPKNTFITERLFATYASLKGWRGKTMPVL